MPFIQVSTNREVSLEKEEKIKTALGKAITLIPGKSETWLMVNIRGDENLYFQGKKDPCAFVEVKLYGGENAKAFSELTSEVTSLLSSTLGIEQQRIYVSYFTTHHWGYSGSNF